jgi:hypothetical protein
VTGRPINALELYSRFKDQWDTTSQPLKERATVLPFGQYEDGSVGLAWPGLLAAPAEGMVNFGRYGYDSPEAIRDNAASAFDVAGGAVTGGLGVGLAGGLADNSVGIFGGRLAKTADQNALMRAEKLAAEGAPREQIWNDTGWFQGVDGKWRFEIDDSGAIPTDKKKSEIFTVPDGLKHDDLFSAYDQFKDMPLNVGRMSMGMSNGQYHGLDRGIHLSGSVAEPSRSSLSRVKEIEASPEYKTTFDTEYPGATNADLDRMLDEWTYSPLGREYTELRRYNSNFGDRAKDTTLHELQHGVQEIEGFNRGSNTEKFAAQGVWRDLYGEAQVVQNRIEYLGEDPVRAANFVAAEKKLDPIQLKYLAETYSRDELSDLVKKNDPYELYRRTAGEAEARTVQARQNLTPEQRQSRPPWLDYDVPEADQIVRFGNSLAANAKSGAAVPLLQNALEMVRDAGSGRAALEQFELPRGWEQQYRAVIEAIDKASGLNANPFTASSIPLAGEAQDTDPALLEYLRLSGQIPY